MRTLVLAAVLSTAMPAMAQYQPSRPYEVWGPHSLEGIYLGFGGGGQLMIADGTNALGWGIEGRIGYSFGVPFSVYLSGSYDASTFNTFNTFSGFGIGTLHTEMVAMFLQYHLYARPQAMVYLRGGVGLGMSPDVSVDGSLAVGLAGQGGFGVEIRLAPGFYLSPELYYKNMYLSGGGGSLGIESLGLQVSLIFY
jgi:hypothetical protein